MTGHDGMSDEEMARIGERFRDHVHAFEQDYSLPDALHDYVTDVEPLLAEVERLRAENAALREHGQEVSRLTAELSGAAIERRDQEIARLRTENAEQAAIINEVTPALLALKDGNAAMWEIAQAVATQWTGTDSGYDEMPEQCIFCQRVYPGMDDDAHTPDCPVTRARALLEGARG